MKNWIRYILIMLTGLSILPSFTTDKKDPPSSVFFKNTNGEICIELYNEYTYEDPYRPRKIVHVVLGYPGQVLNPELSDEEMDLLESFSELTYFEQLVKTNLLMRKGKRVEVCATANGEYPGPIVKGIYFKGIKYSGQSVQWVLFEKKD
jgi:hypothetical protein